MTAPRERDAAREQLRRSVDQLSDRANLYAQMQKDPLKVIGGASGVGLVLGLLIGTRVRRTRRIYVDATSHPRDQKAFAKAQQQVAKGGRGGIGGALGAAILTIAIRVLQERVLRPQLERVADQINERAADRSARPAVVPAGPSTAVAHDPKRPM
ncbi:hypothetical protein [Deinococcus pimensis]|uniref:hypothetical protein n=1 Tax=Deinococcus pimensis TaxID=309888 RepID=UPI0004B97264|nr:hypothetical protein [Deinococcus pimensis]